MFQYENEAKKVYECLIKRLEKYGLEMEQDKTRILPFGRFKGTNETFDFLGFLHYNGITKTGNIQLVIKYQRKRKSPRKRKLSSLLKIIDTQIFMKQLRM